MKTLLNVFLLMVVIMPCRAQKVKPALNLTLGSTYYSVSVIKSAISQTFNGQQVTYNVEISAKAAFKVSDVEDTIYNLEVSYKSIGIKMQSLQGTMDFNSDKANTGAVQSKILNAMVDKPFSVTLSKSGKVLSVKNIENMMTSVFSGITTLDSAKKAQLKSQFMQSFGEESFKTNMEQNMAIYPNVKVAKNDKWVINTVLESNMSANVSSTFQLQDITDTYYLIHGDAKINTLKDKESVESGMPINYDMTGTITVDTKMDKKTGWVIEAKLKEDMAGTFTIKDNPKVPGGMTVPMTIHSDVVSTDQ